MSMWPEIDFPSATEMVGPISLGYGVESAILTGPSKVDYESYKEYLREEGFVELDSFLTISSSPTDISMFRRGTQHVALRHVSDKKTWISFFEDDVSPYCAEELRKELPLFAYDSVEQSEEGFFSFCMEEKKEHFYVSYLRELEDMGYLKYAENQIGIDVCTTIYQKDRCVVSVIYLRNTKKIYIQTGFDIPLSNHLIYREKDLKNIPDEKKTTLAMLQMIRLGSSFVIRLKNGNFIVNDGGIGCELEQLFRYMEMHTEEGKKPHVEAWVISHAHGDHAAVLVMMAENPSLAERVEVDGIYMNIPSKLKRCLHPGESNYQILGVKDASRLLHAPIYRLQTGQRYYFCDITLDILLATEQVPMEIHSNDINDTSTWCLYTIEGQQVMLAGDADRGCCRAFSEIYTKGYWKFDVFTAFHHGSNTSDIVTDHCEFGTILVPRAEEPWKHVEENQRLKAKSKEWFLKGEGTRVLTFPYKTGESITMKEFDEPYDKQKIENAVRKHSKLMKDAYDYIWANPETGYREWKTNDYLAQAFESLGYELVKPGDIPGFYTIIDTGKPGPELLILGELDSLICKEHPDADAETGAVHCCGHSMQSATLLGIAAAMKERGMIEKLCGRIRFCAVPAEELIENEYRMELKKQGVIKYMGGKTEFLSRGYFDGVDLAFMIHTKVGEEAVHTMTDLSFRLNEEYGTGSTDMGGLTLLMPAMHPNMPGAKGISHGADYFIDNPEKSCTDSALVQMYMIHALLKDGGKRAKEIIANFEPTFTSKEEFFAYIDTLERGGERLEYQENERVSVQL